MRSIARKYVNNFISRPAGANKSKIFDQLDMIEEEILNEKIEIDDSPLSEEDINNLIKQKSKLESILQAFTDIDVDSGQRADFQEALDGFYYECKVAEMKLKGENVDPSDFRDMRKQKGEEEDEGEGESGLSMRLEKATDKLS